MSQQVIVDRDLEFRGAALYQPNVKGPMMTELKIIDFGFEGTSSLYGWSSTTGSYGGTLAHAAVDGGAMTLTMGAVANDCIEFYHETQWSPYYNCGVEIKMKISATTDVAVCGGFVDAYRNTNDQVAMEITGTTLQDRVADSCGFVFDTNQGTDVWYVAACNNGQEGTPVAAVGTLVPVADTYFKIRIQTDSDGFVRFYYNGTAVGSLGDNTIAHAVGNLLTPYVGFISRGTGSLVCTVSRIILWQDN